MKVEGITPAAGRLVIAGAVIAVVAATATLIVRSTPENASALLFVLAVIVEVVIAPIPGGAIAYMGAARFGFWQAWPLLYVGNVVGTVLVFVLVRRFGAPLFRTSISEGTRRRYDGVLHEHAILLCLLYSVPLMPVDILSILAGLSSIAARKFLTITVTGYLTYTGIVAFLGDFAADVMGAPEAMAGFGVILLGALIGWFWPRPDGDGRVGTDTAWRPLAGGGGGLAAINSRLTTESSSVKLLGLHTDETAVRQLRCHRNHNVRRKHVPMVRFAAFCAAFFVTGCGGSSPSRPSRPQSPTPPPTPPAPALLTLSGFVRATNGGQTLPGATVEAASISSETDSEGHYSLNLPTGTQSPAFAIRGPGLVTRLGFFSGSASRTVDLDAFVLSGFDQAYFRAIARNGYEQPGSLQALRRWTRAPMIYVRTVDDTGREILSEVLQQVVSIVTGAIPQYTNGRFRVAGIEHGTETRKGQAGWITVEWTRDATQFCGWANVGQEGGIITLTYDQPGCSCGSQKIRPRTVKHEIGHALGLWHTGQSADLMSGVGVAECDRNITSRELLYLDYLYRRPVGNTDPDNDPLAAAVLNPVRVIN